MTDRREDAARRAEADAILARVARDSESLGSSAAARAGTGAAPEAQDWAEVWGRRIGRSLGLVAAVGLALWLLATYF